MCCCAAGSIFVHTAVSIFMCLHVHVHGHGHGYGMRMWQRMLCVPLVSLWWVDVVGVRGELSIVSLKTLVRRAHT